MLIDLSMPHIDGCELVARFRRNSTFAHTKIVAVTGHADEQSTSLALKAGFDSILAKPVTMATIEKVLASVEDRASTNHQSLRLPERAGRGFGDIS